MIKKILFKREKLKDEEIVLFLNGDLDFQFENVRYYFDDEISYYELQDGKLDDDFFDNLCISINKYLNGIICNYERFFRYKVNFDIKENNIMVYEFSDVIGNYNSKIKDSLEIGRVVKQILKLNFICSLDFVIFCNGKQYVSKRKIYV